MQFKTYNRAEVENTATQPCTQQLFFDFFCLRNIKEICCLTRQEFVPMPTPSWSLPGWHDPITGQLQSPKHRGLRRRRRLSEVV